MKKKFSINHIYQGPFPKSLIYLYPILNIPHDVHKPLHVYLGIEGQVSVHEERLVCIYDSSALGFELFEQCYLMLHEGLYDRFELEGSRKIYVFEFPDSDTWECFLTGKYSRFPEDYKQTVIKAVSKYPGNDIYMRSFFYPEAFFDNYAHILNVPVELLQEVGELCSLPDMQHEIFPALTRVA